MGQRAVVQRPRPRAASARYVVGRSATSPGGPHSPVKAALRPLSANAHALCIYVAATNGPRVGAGPETSRIPEKIQLLGRELARCAPQRKCDSPRALDRRSRSGSRGGHPQPEGLFFVPCRSRQRSWAVPERDHRKVERRARNAAREPGDLDARAAPRVRRRVGEVLIYLPVARGHPRVRRPAAPRPPCRRQRAVRPSRRHGRHGKRARASRASRDARGGQRSERPSRLDHRERAAWHLRARPKLSLRAGEQRDGKDQRYAAGGALRKDAARAARPPGRGADTCARGSARREDLRRGASWLYASCPRGHAELANVLVSGPRCRADARRRRDRPGNHRPETARICAR